MMTNIKKFITKIKEKSWFGRAVSISVLIIFIFIFFILYLLNKNISSLNERLLTLQTNLSSSTIELSTRISQSHDNLSTAINQEKQNVGSIEQKLGVYQQQVGDVTGTVTNLQKLSKTDPELLEKYSKVFFLNENYAPARLTEVPSQYKYSDNKIEKLSTPVWPFIQKMIDDANKASTTLYIFSAYRSFNEQRALKGQYSVTYGAGTANQFSADQGYSEHQLGTTVDLITPGLGGSLDGFDNTKAYKWLQSNAYKYGFILSYPKNNSFYVFEPWHWRFVGIKLATYLHDNNKNFYDMDQRDIDEYLVNLFD